MPKGRKEGEAVLAGDAAGLGGQQVALAGGLGQLQGL